MMVMEILDSISMEAVDTTTTVGRDISTKEEMATTIMARSIFTTTLEEVMASTMEIAMAETVPTTSPAGISAKWSASNAGRPDTMLVIARRRRM
jgi:hypothetical protein